MDDNDRIAFYDAMERGEQHPLVMVATLAMALWVEEKNKKPNVGAEAFTPESGGKGA